MHAERARLTELLGQFGSVLVGYSGGVDSVLLAKVATDVLGRHNVLAATGVSASLSTHMAETAGRVAHDFGIPWLRVRTDEMADERYASNPSNRCYFCKTELWSKLRGVARERGLRVVADGANVDDQGDHRPGALAGAERDIRSPLIEAGLTKDRIRAWSRDLGLPTWDQPAAPCLASRLPYGFAVTPERLAQVDAAEAALRALGFTEFRVRHHDSVARLEVATAELSRIQELRGEVTEALRRAGFRRVVLDLQGYRRGALNEGLPLVQLSARA